MPIVEKATDVGVPVRIAYKQWTMFEEFPRFMEGVGYVRKLDPLHVRWSAEYGGRTLEWDAEITEQVVDEKIAWRSTSQAANQGCVTFERLGDSRCRIHLHLRIDRVLVTERTPDPVGVFARRAARDLERFKQLVEISPPSPS